VLGLARPEGGWLSVGAGVGWGVDLRRLGRRDRLLNGRQRCRTKARVMRYPRKLWIAGWSEGEVAGVKKAAYPSV
jgi:hypothetical protein